MPAKVLIGTNCKSFVRSAIVEDTWICLFMCLYVSRLEEDLHE